MGFFSKFFDAGIHGAINNGDVEKVNELLNDGSSPHEKRLEMNALMAAAEVANPAIVEILLEKGARVNDPNSAGKTALMFAAAGKGAKGKDKEGRCVETVRLLLASGADVNAQGRWGQTAVAFAAGAGHKRVKELLVEHGARQ